MTLRITQKLFIAILITNVVIAISFAVATQISVNLGFRDYVREREQRRLQSIADVLAFLYADHGNWDFLRDDDEQWSQLAHLRGSDAAPPRLPPSGDDIDREAARPPPFDGSVFDKFAGGREGFRERGPPPPKPASGMPGAPRNAPPAALALIDADQRLVAGSIDPQQDPMLLEPVDVEGRTVGWLRAQAPTLGGADAAFLREQVRASWIMLAFAILLAAGVAILLARGFLAPIRHLARATHRLAAGDYSLRVRAGSRDELGQLVDDFNRLAQTLRAADETRRAFLADVSHELRTPLAILRGELEALQDGIRSPTPDAVRSLRTEVDTLGTLVDDLYDLALADVGAINYDKTDVDVAELVRTTLRAFETRLTDRGLTLDASDIAHQAFVNGDARRLTQLLNNLVENALRYTDAGGRVRVSVRNVERDAVLIIEDSAPGVPAELLPRLFERLFRVESSRNRRDGGAGLGLSLCRSIVEAHGGKIAADASSLGGVRIEVQLPATS